MPIDLEKFKKKDIDLSQFRKPVVDGKFTVPVSEGQKATRLKESQRAAAQSAEKARKANSFLGKAGNFGKALIENIAPSEVGLGKTIGGILYQGSKADQNLQTAVAGMEDSKQQLLKAIKEKEAAGQDTTTLKQAYNQLATEADKSRQTASDLVQLPTNMQAAGQIGGTALDLLTAGTYGKAKTAGMQTGKLLTKGSAVRGAAAAAGVPEIGVLAGQKAGGLFTRRGAANIATGAGVGYASDVSMGLQGLRGEEREGGKAFIPGLGTAIGTAIPLTNEMATSIRNIKTGDARIAAKRHKGLSDIQSKNKKIDSIYKAAEKKGVDAKKVLSETNLLNGAVDTDGRISSDAALANFDEFIKPYESKVRESLVEEGRSINMTQIVDDAIKFVDDSRLSAPQKADLQRELAKNMEAFSQFNGNNIPLTSIHDTKVYLGSNNNYLNPAKDKVDKEAARFFKEMVENNSTIMDVKLHNSELSKLYSIRELLINLDKKIVTGGRLGKYFASTVGAMAGGSAGGPLGAIVGAEVGAKVKGGMMERAFGGQIQKGLKPTKALIAAQKPIKTGKAAIPEVVVPGVKKDIPDLKVGDQSKSPGSLKTNQSATIPITKVNGIEPTKSQVPKKVKGDNLGTEVKKKIATAKKVQPTFKNDVASIAKELNLDYKVADVKSYDRVLQKAMHEEGGDLSKIRDVNRSVVFVDNLSDKAKIGEIAKAAAKKFGSVVRVTQTVGTPGYNKVIINVPTKAGQAEIQLTTRQMWDSKIQGGDVLYGLERSPKTAPEVAKQLNLRASELYDAVAGDVLGNSQKAIKEGGVTMDIVRNIDYAGTPHISVAPFPERSKLIKGEVTQLDIADYLEENIDLFEKEGYSLGGWFDEESGQTYLDVAVAISKDKKDEVMDLARKSNQKAVFDLETFTEINTGGTGEVTGSIPYEERVKLVNKILDKSSG